MSRTIVDAIVGKDATGVKGEFTRILEEKTSDLLEAKKVQIGQNYFAQKEPAAQE
jgi:predicted amino acid-binding ACT domain protein